MTFRSCARHRAERDPLATLTGAIRTVAADAPKGAGRSAVVVATAGGIVMSAIAPAPAEAAPGVSVTATYAKVAKIAGQARQALSAAPTVHVSPDSVVEVEAITADGVAAVNVTPAPPPPPPPPPAPSPRATPAAASRTADRSAGNPSAPGRAWGAAAEIAQRYLGVRYVFGSSNPSVGLDCSGLVVHVYRQLGVDLPHQSTRIRDASRTVRIPRSQAHPGDIIWSPGHVSIYLGNGRQIEATRPGGWTVRTANIWQSNPMFLRVV